MTGRRNEHEIDERLSRVRRLLQGRHAGIEPDAHFANRVIARLPRNEARWFEWAVRRILPVSIAVAMALVVAVIATGGFASRTATTAAASSTSRTTSDPLEWLLEGRQELR